jgi:outer membrane protein OmpA-like peptidoglycan-associated protein
MKESMTQWAARARSPLGGTLGTSLGCFVVAAGTLLPALAGAQATPGNGVLKDDEVTEKSVIERLTPHMTRGLRVAPDAAGAGQEAAPSLHLLITFATNSTNLTAKSREQLDVVGRAIQGERLAGFSFIVEGHADRRGSSAANMALSLARAQAVRAYLIHTDAVEDARLRAVGKGDAEPLNREDVAAPENRRVTFITQTP